jgi:acetyl esterase/lipase
MPSLRSRLCRLLIKYLVATKFNPAKTIGEIRRGAESLTKLTGFPSQTRVEKIRLNSLSAEWVFANEARKDRAILYLHGGGYNFCSPWTDLTMSGDSIKTHSVIDPMLNLQSMKLMASNYIGDNDPRNPLISPIYANLEGIPSTLIHVGSDEMLLDDAIRMAEKAKSAGVDVTLKIYDKMWHVWHLNARLMPEAKNTIKKFGSFIRQHFVNKRNDMPMIQR